MIKKREIYIRIKEIKEILQLLEEIRDLTNQTNQLFSDYEKLNEMENNLFENWNNYLEDITQKVDRITL